MAKVSTIITAVESIVDDSSYGPSTILTVLNRGQLEIAGGILLPNGRVSSPLPELVTSGTKATTTAAYVQVPDTYQRNLFFVSSLAQSGRIRLVTSFAKFLAAYPRLDEAGSVSAVCLRGRTLYYQPIPSSADTLTLWYHRYPTDMTTASSSEPDGIPEHLQEALLVNYAAKSIFNEIEDGIEGPKINTQKYESRFMEAVLALEETTAADPEAINIEGDGDDFI